MARFTKIESRIIETLRQYAIKASEDNIQSNRDWTSRLFEALALLGESFDFSVCVGGFGSRFGAEWLFDLLWYEEKGEGVNSRLVNIPLVVESEWNISFHQIKYDFEKLLAANAQHRLFVCYVSRNNLQSMKSYFLEAVQKFKLGRKGDRFLIAILMMDSNEFEFQQIIRN